MASPSSPQHEPTMEEILASIRKIISEDSSEPAAAPQPVVQAPAPQPVAFASETDVLELTHEIEEMPAPAPVPPPAPVVAVAPTEPVHPDDEVVFQTIEEPPPVKAAAQAQAPDGLISDKARNAIDDALAGLDIAPEDERTPAQPVAPIDGRSVESVFDRAVRETFDPVLRAWLHEQADVIVERMRPAIREWMEDNLPPMLKTAVEAEVARAVRARTRR